MSGSEDAYYSFDDYYDFNEEEYESEEQNDIEYNLNLSGYISRKKSYDIFDEKELLQSSMDTVKETKECLELTSKAITIVLLKHFKCVYYFISKKIWTNINSFSIKDGIKSLQLRNLLS